MKLQFIDCKICGESHHVGVANKKVEGRGSSGEYGPIPFVAFGCDELKDSDPIYAGDTSLCPKCGVECIVEDGQESKKGEG